MFDVQTIHASTVIVDAYKLILQVHSQGLSIIDIGKASITLSITKANRL
jgi:ATP-dependent Clp protease adapter protein ClpS